MSARMSSDGAAIDSNSEPNSVPSTPEKEKEKEKEKKEKEKEVEEGDGLSTAPIPSLIPKEEIVSETPIKAPLTPITPLHARSQSLPVINPATPLTPMNDFVSRVRKESNNFASPWKVTLSSAQNVLLSSSTSSTCYLSLFLLLPSFVLPLSCFSPRLLPTFLCRTSSHVLRLSFSFSSFFPPRSLSLSSTTTSNSLQSISSNRSIWTVIPGPHPS